ncbi:hypothetical protein N7449_010901 [Penicillium cf. viridicatum]|uniref:Uncharacterized protein n=1 Tax=Penicillium cf. viridicatum TaxID=2972119 RepID=A0A9W9J176_9EURO|nr:hypothetical protein N7449_010901 [Penicillium cf. viridicatum]
MVFDGGPYRRHPTITWNFGRKEKFGGKRVSSLPLCLLCAIPIVEAWINEDRPTRREIDEEQERWKTYDDSAKKHVLVPSAEVEKTILHKHPQIWKALYRGSGSGGTGSTASPHRHAASQSSIEIGEFKELGAARVTSPEGPDPYWPPAERPGYLVHAHCWALFDQVIEGGVARIEANLDVFVQAVQHFWQKDRLRHTHDYQVGWCIQHEIPSDSDSPGPSYCEMKEDALHNLCTNCQNPLFVLKFEEAIQRNRIRGKVHLQVGFGNFPLDLAILIIDTVCPAKYTAIEVQNARNLLEAFQWTLPDGYWQKRCDSSLLFEVKKLKKTKAQVDWQALGLDLMSLLVEDEFTSGLRNRERVLLFMGRIKRRFIELL